MSVVDRCGLKTDETIKMVTENLSGRLSSPCDTHKAKKNMLTSYLLNHNIYSSHGIHPRLKRDNFNTQPHTATY